MSRPTRTDIGTLLQEARAMEMLANEVDVSLERMQDYWSLAADLITLVADIEMLQAEDPAISYEDPRMFALKYRLRDISSRVGSLEDE